MRGVFSFHFYNSPFEDSILYAYQMNAKEDLLFDLGDVRNVPSHHLLRVKRVFVSHTHMDHFSGFHSFLRTILKLYGKEVEIYGPVGIIKNVYGAISSYTWNLLDEYKLSFRVFEITENEIQEALLDSDNLFEPEMIDSKPFYSTLVDMPLYRVKTEILEHKIPVLGFRLEEKNLYSVNKQALAEWGLAPGHWLALAKNTLNTKAPNLDQKIEVAPSRFEDLKTIKEKIFLYQKKPSYAYLTDFGFSSENIKKALRLAKDVKTLFIESHFCTGENHLAEKTRHLTASQAGFIAGKAGAYQVKLFHFSQRYLPDKDNIVKMIYEEMETAKTKAEEAFE